MEHDPRTWALDALRWTASALIVFAAFGLIGWCVAKQPMVVTDTGGGEPALEIDLLPAPQAAPDPPPAPEAVASERPASSETQEETQPPAPPLPDITPRPSASSPDMPMPRPVEQPKQVVEAAKASSGATPPDTIEDPISTPAPSLPGKTDEPPSHAVLTWQRLLVGRLEQAKRYPAGADGRSGATRVAFSIDATGRLVARHIISSAGNNALDEAAMDLLRRCQPFPAPPRGTNVDRLSFTVTIRYAR